MKKLPQAVLIILKTYLLSLITFLLFRIIQFLIHYSDVMHDKDFSFLEIVDSFFYGFRFDTVIISYLLIVPFLLQRIIFEFIFLLFISSFLIAMADIPYYNKFYNRLTIESFEWFNDPTIVIGMVFQDIKLWSLFIPLFFILWFVRKLLYKIFYLKTNTKQTNSVLFYIPTVFLIVLGLRGTVREAPLRYRDAFGGKNMFLNALKLNPVYTIEKSYEEKLKNKNHILNLIDQQLAIKNTRSYFAVSDSTKFKSPIARSINYQSNTETKKKNVVLILMESLGASKMSYFGSTENRTPFLDSLFLKSLSFTNLYSNGIHTYAGIFGTNYSYPMLFNKHPMTGVVLKKHNGLPYTLLKNGYQTSFFVSGNGSFDNMTNFLLSNSYNRIYTEADYPKKEQLNVYGVSDDYLLNFALETITKKSNKNQPFLATILTISDHIPYRFPDYYQSNTKNKNIKATQFADWSIKQFMKKAAKQAWYDNTIFVFVADHGQAQGVINYKTPLTYNHTPLIYFYKGIEHQIVDKIASQLDVYPTLMGLLKINYTNNSFGINLLHENRQYTIFNHDKEYGIIDKEFLLIVNRNETIGLYKYPKKDKTNYKNEYPKIVKKMETYFKSQIQTYQYMLTNNLQFVE